MKNILGLDIGTNSIGWAVVNSSNNCNDNTIKSIESAGSRIIPMDAAQMSDFAIGNTKSQTAERTRLRGVRRLLEREHLRRERLCRTLDKMEFLPPHFSSSLNRYGQVTDNENLKIAWSKNTDGKYEFLFTDSFREMLSLFQDRNPELLEQGHKVPYDWTIYYLRKKALSQPISKYELSWLLLNFNAKRGYYQLRGEDTDEDNSKKIEYQAHKVVRVENTGERRGKDYWFNIYLENGLVYRRTASSEPKWEGQVRDFIVTMPLDADGKQKLDKDGNPRYSLRMPAEDDWMLLKKKTEADIEKSGKTVGEYIFDELLINPKTKIRGKFVRTIERKYYKSELIQILEAQRKYIVELNDMAMYAKCVESLYPSNEAYRNSIATRGFTYLFVNDIIFYQRPLKSKKNLISDCPYERHEIVDKTTGEVKIFPIKCISKSHPLFQEFRLWQFVSNLRIYSLEEFENGKEKDVTSNFLHTKDDYANLFDYLNQIETITQDALLTKYFNIKKPRVKGAKMPYRWNYVEDKTYPCNETRARILTRLDKAGIDAGFLTHDREEHLWHILYSVSDRQQLKATLSRYADKEGCGQLFVDQFSSFPPFAKDYGAYSAKAIKKLLPIMRCGKYWDVSDIDEATKVRIDKIITGEYDENIKNRVRNKAMHLQDMASFQGLPVWLATYIVYNRHSETSNAERWNKPEDIDAYLAAFKHHSLRNPIVEQVILETLRVVRDIWRKYGHIDEIHIELGREMKNPADKRREMTMRIQENENANLRIKALLTEFLNPEYKIDNVRPNSPSQQDLMRIYEDGALNSVEEVPEDVDDIIKKFAQADIKKRPTSSEIMRYKCWLEQNYRSPYTGKHISLAKLFTPAYEIEHIIPQSLYFDDSFSNKVICESEVNKLKGNQLGMQFIKEHKGEIVHTGFGTSVQILSPEQYETLVKSDFKKSRTKMGKLLMEDIPEDFIQRQLNDSRYISKVVKSLLSNVVREEDEQEDISKNVIPCSGAITDRLKKDWGVNDVWNHIVLPRFRRMNEITNTSNYTTITDNGHEIPSMPLAEQRGFSKKRIDHRHHAMDAIVIACTTRSHVNLLNNEAAMPKNKANRYLLSRKLRRYEDVQVNRNGQMRTLSVAKEFIKPWPTFTTDVEKALSEIVVSFKQNLRVITHTSNHYTHIVNGKKVTATQTKGDHLAIRKPMHKDTVFGEINLQRIKVVKIDQAILKPERIKDKLLRRQIKELLAQGLNVKAVKKYFKDNSEQWEHVNVNRIDVFYYTKETTDRFFATRKPIDTSFTADRIKKTIADSAIQKIMLTHLANYDGNADIAFSSEGIEQMNNNICQLNGGVAHQPIFKVRVYEQASKFAVGQSGCKAKKFVEAAKGTNLFFAVYQTDAGRTFASIPLNVVIERQKQGLPPAPNNEDGTEPLFVLSPNDLVYVPTSEEVEVGKVCEPIDKSRIYKMVSCTGNRLYLINYNVSSSIVDKIEFTQLNKVEFTDDKVSIKKVCIPIKVDRLGNIISINNNYMP